MGFFKKRWVAVILTLCIMWASVLLSTSIRFGDKCSEITDGFYTGVQTHKSYSQPSIASHLQNICGYADGIATIAARYDIAADSLLERNEDLKLSLRYSRGWESYIYDCYDRLMKELAVVQRSLEEKELSERDEKGLAQYSSNLTGAQSSIAKSDYNETVSRFLRKYDRFPTDVLAEMAGVDMPEYFGMPGYVSEISTDYGVTDYASGKAETN